MNEDCQKCGTAMWDLDDDDLCPRCANDYSPPCPECGDHDCNGQCAGDDMMGASS